MGNIPLSNNNDITVYNFLCAAAAAIKGWYFPLETGLLWFEALNLVTKLLPHFT